jgi:hypothetical protein
VPLEEMVPTSTVARAAPRFDMSTQPVDLAVVADCGVMRARRVPRSLGLRFTFID